MIVRSLGLICSILGKVGRNHLIQDVKQKRLKWCLNMWVQEKMVPKHELLENVSPHVQELNYRKNFYELEDHVREEALSLDLPLKFGPIKEFLLHFLIIIHLKTLKSNPHFFMPYCPTTKGRTRHHWGNKRSKCQIVTS
jgi:hypothetical protein